MTQLEGCIFCKIAKGESPCHKIWEDNKHLAFLSIFPNKVDKFFSKYEGYISSHDYKREDDLRLSDLAKTIRE